MSTGFSAAEHGGVRLGDSIEVFAQGPIGLCATARANRRGLRSLLPSARRRHEGGPPTV